MPNTIAQPINIAQYDWNDLDRAMVGTPDLMALFRETLQHTQRILQQQFKNNARADELVHMRANTVDQLLKRAWKHFIGPADTNVALIAVGGYGRGELHPASDIDLLILLDGKQHEAYAERIQFFLTFLWDIGLEVGQSVRSIKECITEAKRDITVATNLMEARLIDGPIQLYNSFLDKVGPKKIWSSQKFFRAKLAEQIERHHRYHDTAYNLEPNIKENPGGLRDIQVIGWVAKRHFGATTLKDLVAHKFLTPDEHRTLIDSQNFLWRIRIGLHLATGRREDRLMFDHQRELATQFGYVDDEHRLGVEKFMKTYYRTVLELNRLNEMLLQLFEEATLNEGKHLKVTPINKRFRARNGFVEVTNNNIFKRYPFALLEIFLILQQHPELRGVRAETIRLIRSHCDRIDEKFRNDVRCQSLFMEIFKQPHGLTHELRRMNRYGILAAYLPIFGHIVGQMQHDLFHTYTVDEHTLMLVRNLRRFTVAEFADEFPLCSKIIKNIPKQELLYLAGFFHDIAKGRGGDHSTLGSADAVKFGQSHGLSQYDTHLIAWLVQNHLVMSTTAQRKDISDPDVVNDFAEMIGSQERLDYLYLLTVADIRATSPTLWNSWKDSLIADLYYTTSRAFRRGLQNPIDQSERIAETKSVALSQLVAQQFSEDTILTFWEALDDDYFLRHSADEIIWHIQSIFKHKPEDYPLVLIREQTHRGGTELFICTQDENYIFALTTAAIARLGLNITDARIITSKNGITMDTFILLEKNGEPILDPHRIADIKTKITRILANPSYENVVASQPNKPLSRQLKHFPRETEITFRTDTRNRVTIMEVIARDQPGFLARIARALVECNINIHKAKIATFGAKAEDIFYITNKRKNPIESVDQLNKLRKTIIEFLDR